MDLDEKSSRPTLPDIEELTAYLPRLYTDGFSPVIQWEGGEQLKDESFTLPYPKYHPLVEEFYGHISRAGWLDHEYDPEQAYKMLRDEHLVERANLSQIRSMLPFCVRGERFSDGHWGEMIREGHIRRLLERLNQIRSEMK